MAARRELSRKSGEWIVTILHRNLCHCGCGGGVVCHLECFTCSKYSDLDDADFESILKGEKEWDDLCSLPAAKDQQEE